MFKDSGGDWCRNVFIEAPRKAVCQAAVLRYADNPFVPNGHEELRRSIFCAGFVDPVSSETLEQCRSDWGDASKLDEASVARREETFRRRDSVAFSVASRVLRQFDEQGFFVPPKKAFPAAPVAAAAQVETETAGEPTRAVQETVARATAQLGVASAAPAATRAPGPARSPAGRRPTFFQRAPEAEAPRPSVGMTDETLRAMMKLLEECLKKIPSGEAKAATPG